MLLKLEYVLNWNVTQIGNTLKLECCLNWITEIRMSLKGEPDAAELGANTFFMFYFSRY